ncbi:hypothetical protein H0O03_04120 [Candidatus Micrarchaeota archaeon]|nr:hypothetical protein [Candidatus Micrarchaeota archaeon]
METGQGDQQVCKVEGKASGQGGSLEVSCNFDEQFQQNMPDGETVAYLDLDIASPENPSARLQATIEIVLVKTPGADEVPRLAMRPSTSIQYLCNIDTDAQNGEIARGEAAALTYQFPRGSTEHSLVLLDPEGSQSSMINLGAIRDSASTAFTIPSNAAGGQYIWRMIYNLGGSLSQADCPFIVYAPIQPAAPNQPPSLETEVGRYSSFCDTPSMHPIRNIVVYNVARGNAVVRTSGNHFSNQNSEAYVRVCIRSDEQISDLSNAPIKVKFVPSSVSDISLVDFNKDIRFSCTRVSVDAKQFYDCRSDSRPVRDFADSLSSSSATLKTVVDASQMIARFYDYTPTGISEFQKRFYCQAWPLDRRAASTQTSYGLPSGGESDAIVYGAGIAAGYAGNNGLAPDPMCSGVSSVHFGVAAGSGASPSTHHPPSGSHSDPLLGNYGSSATGLTAAGTLAGRDERAISFAGGTLSFAGGLYVLASDGRIRYTGLTSATSVAVTWINASGATSERLAGPVSVNLTMSSGALTLVPVCSLSGRRYKIKLEFQVSGDTVPRWVGYSGGHPTLVQNEADAISISQEAVSGCASTTSGAGTPSDFTYVVSAPSWSMVEGNAEWESGELQYTFTGLLTSASAECFPVSGSGTCQITNAQTTFTSVQKVFRLLPSQITAETLSRIKLTIHHSDGRTFERWVGADGNLVTQQSQALKILAHYGGAGQAPAQTPAAFHVSVRPYGGYNAEDTPLWSGQSRDVVLRPSATYGNSGMYSLITDDSCDSIGGVVDYAGYSARVTRVADAQSVEIAAGPYTAYNSGSTNIDDDSLGCSTSSGGELEGLQCPHKIFDKTIGSTRYAIYCYLAYVNPEGCAPWYLNCEIQTRINCNLFAGSDAVTSAEEDARLCIIWHD